MTLPFILFAILRQAFHFQKMNDISVGLMQN